MFLEDPGLYYEAHGQGKPLILLNGIMTNTLSWAEHIGRLGRNRRLILFDMRDQGQSDRMAPGYDITVHAEDMKKLLVSLGVSKVDIMGVSYGGQVGLLFALKYPDMVDRLVLANTTDHMDQYLLSLGEMWKRAALLYDGEAFFDIALTPIYSRNFYNNHYDWLAKRRNLFRDLLTRDWFDGLIRLASSNGAYDIREELGRISHPTLLIAAEEDIITPYAQMRRMAERIPHCLFVCIPEAGHAAFLEKIDEFCAIINGFLG